MRISISSDGFAPRRFGSLRPKSRTYDRLHVSGQHYSAKQNHLTKMASNCSDVQTLKLDRAFSARAMTIREGVEAFMHNDVMSWSGACDDNVSCVRAIFAVLAASIWLAWYL